MKWYWPERIWEKQRKLNNMNAQSGLGKRKAEQDRFVFLFSTRKLIVIFNMPLFNSNCNAGFDSS